jgi:hypothetical protein
MKSNSDIQPIPRPNALTHVGQDSRLEKRNENILHHLNTGTARRVLPYPGT